MSVAIAVVTGTGAHADPWHDLGETSGAIAAVLSDDGDVTRLTTDELAPGVLDDVDVVVVNASADLAAPPSDSSDVVAELHAHASRGGGVVAVHSSSLAFPDDDRWARLLGGRWVPGRSGHPQIGNALVQAAGSPLLSDDFTLYDERYTLLETADDTELVAFHTEDGVPHPLVWLHRSPSGVVAYSALGHGVEAYDSSNAFLLRSLVAAVRPPLEKVLR